MSKYSIETCFKIIAYGNWLFAILLAICTLLDIEIGKTCSKTISRVLIQSPNAGTQQLGEMVTYSQNVTLGLFLLLVGCLVGNGALFFWMNKKVKLNYGNL